MKSLKKLIPLILYTTLILSIFIMCFVIVQNNNKLNADGILNSQQEQPTQSENEQLPNDTIELPSTSMPNNTENEEIDNVFLYNDSVPRSSFASDKYLYTQKIYGNSTTNLHNVINSPLGIFIICSSSSTIGDVSGTSPTIGIVKIDTSGNVLNVFNFTYTYTENYISSAITQNGIIIISTEASKNYLYVNIIPLSLDNISTFRIPYAPNANLSVNTETFFIFAEYTNENVVYKYCNGDFIFQSINKGIIVDFFDFGNYYTIFTKDANSNNYTISKLNVETLNLIYTQSFNNTNLLYVAPIMEEKTQFFIVLEEKLGIVYAKKYATDMYELISEKRLGSSTIVNVLYSENELLLVCNGNINGIITLYSDLHTDFYETNVAFEITNVLDVNFINNTVYCICSNSKDELAMLTCNENTTSIQYIEGTSKKASFILNNNGTFCILYETPTAIEIIGLSR